MKGATKFSYTDGGGDTIYACLNGRRMTCYVSDYGHLHPQTFVGGIPGAAPPGIGSALTGFPPEANIGTDGRIEPEPGGPAYSLLRSYEDRTYEGSTEAAIVGRRELITLGSGGVCASWGVKGDHADLNPFSTLGVIATDGVVGTLNVSGADATGTISADTSVTFLESGGGTDLLGVALDFSFQNGSSELEQVRIKVEVTLTDLFGAGLTGVSFGFAIDPNPSFTTGSALTQFFTPTDTTAFAVNGTVGTGEHCVGLGVYAGDGEGAIVGYTNTTTEASVCANFEGQIAAHDTIRLGAGNAADYYVGGVFDSSTSDFETDAAWRAGLSSATGSYAIFVRSPEYDIGASGSQTFVFYIFTLLTEEEAAAPVTHAWGYTS